jgi:hypothetical protein
MIRSTSMTATVRATRTTQAPTPQPAETAWLDALSGLVRSHRARLVAPDPSRPWLASASPEPRPEAEPR